MLGIISHPACLSHDAGPDHPESALRLNAISDRLIASGLEYICRHYDAPKASLDALARVHSKNHIDRIAAAIPESGYARIDGDTTVSPESLEAARRAAGAGILGVDLLFAGTISPAFALVRPPGHHAEREAALGFCLFNNIAIAAAHALEAHGAERVAIVDFDVHHCNGTEDIWGGDDRILICSSFQHPLYPFSGVENPPDNLISIPLPAGSNGQRFRQEVENLWLPRLETFKPDLVLVSAGFDAHVLDDMSALGLIEDDYRWISEKLASLAAKHCQNRLLSMLEGGYETGSLARSVVAHIRGLVD